MTEVMKKEEAYVAESIIEEEEIKIMNIAVFGLDQNENGTDERSDAMKVLSLDTKSKIAKLTSLQRDTLIYILSDTVMKTEQNIYETFGYIEKK